MKDKLPPSHPGAHIKLSLDEMGISNAKAAAILGISRAHMGDIVKGKRNLSTEMCFKISGLIGSTPEFWSALQNQYDLKMAERDKILRMTVNRIKQGVRNLDLAHV